MHRYALYPELDIDQAAELIADANGTPTKRHVWGMVLEEAIKRGELPAHDREVPSIVTALIAGDPTKPLLMENVLHVKREDLQRFCAKHRIQLPWAPAPSAPAPKKKMSAVDKQKAAFDQWIADQDGQVLGSLKRADVVLALKELEPFRHLKLSSRRTFWKKHGKKRVEEAQATPPKRRAKNKR